MQGHGRTRVLAILDATQHKENIVGSPRDVRYYQQHQVGNRNRFRFSYRYDILGRRVRKENLQVSAFYNSNRILKKINVY